MTNEIIIGNVYKRKHSAAKFKVSREATDIELSEYNLSSKAYWLSEEGNFSLKLFSEKQFREHFVIGEDADLFSTAKSKAAKVEPGRKVVTMKLDGANPKLPPTPEIGPDGLTKTQRRKLNKRLREEAYKQELEDERKRLEAIEFEKETAKQHRLLRLYHSEIADNNPRKENIWARESLLNHIEGSIPDLIEKLSKHKNGHVEVDYDSEDGISFDVLYERDETDEEWGERLIYIEDMILEAEYAKLEKLRAKEVARVRAEAKKLQKIKDLEAEIKRLKSEK